MKNKHPREAMRCPELQVCLQFVFWMLDPPEAIHHTGAPRFRSHIYIYIYIYIYPYIYPYIYIYMCASETERRILRNPAEEMMPGTQDTDGTRDVGHGRTREDTGHGTGHGTYKYIGHTVVSVPEVFTHRNLVLEIWSRLFFKCLQRLLISKTNAGLLVG